MKLNSGEVNSTALRHIVKACRARALKPGLWTPTTKLLQCTLQHRPAEWLLCVGWKWKSLSLTLCNPMDYRVHGILQARILDRVAIPFSRGSSQLKIKPRSPTLQTDSLPEEPQGKATMLWLALNKLKYVKYLIWSQAHRKGEYNGPCLKGLLWHLSDLIVLQFLAWCLAYTKHSINEIDHCY